MTTNNKRRWFYAIVVLCVLGVAGKAAQHELYVRQLTSHSTNARRGESFATQAEYETAQQKWMQQRQLWAQRNQRNIAPQMLVFLRDQRLRYQTIKALGWLEFPVALKPLQKLQRDIEAGRIDEKKIIVQLAIARIQSHNFKGRKKLDSVAKSVGLSWQDIVRLSYTVYAPKTPNERYAVQGSDAMDIVREFCNLLYDMGRKGENVQQWGDQLTLHPALRVYLKGANTSRSQSVKMILDYVTTLESVTVEDQQVAQIHLLSLGEPAYLQIATKLRDILLHPEKYRTRYWRKTPQKITPQTKFLTIDTGIKITMVIDAAGLSGQRRFLPLLKQFEKKPAQDFGAYGKYVIGSAQNARRAIESGSMSPPLPTF